MAPRSVRFGVRSRNLSNVGQPLESVPYCAPYVSSIRRVLSALGVRSWNLSIVLIGSVTRIYYFELLHSSEGTLNRWCSC
jgi:hypothetical protein